MMVRWFLRCHLLPRPSVITHLSGSPAQEMMVAGTYPNRKVTTLMHGLASGETAESRETRLCIGAFPFDCRELLVIEGLERGGDSLVALSLDHLLLLRVDLVQFS